MPSPSESRFSIEANALFGLPGPPAFLNAKPYWFRELLLVKLV